MIGAEGGLPRRLTPEPSVDYNPSWSRDGRGIYFAEAPSVGARSRAYAIRYLDFESGQVSELFRKEGPFRHQSLAVSSDEQWILRVERLERQSELMLVENFR